MFFRFFDSNICKLNPRAFSRIFLTFQKNNFVKKIPKNSIFSSAKFLFEIFQITFLLEMHAKNVNSGSEYGCVFIFLDFFFDLPRGKKSCSLSGAYKDTKSRGCIWPKNRYKNQKPRGCKIKRIKI